MDGQEKSPVSESLAAHETGLGFESLQSRLQRYGAGKMRALIWQSISRKTQRASGTTENGIQKLVN